MSFNQLAPFILGRKRHETARQDSLVLLGSAMKKGNSPTILWPTATNFDMQKRSKENNRKNNKTTTRRQHHLGAASLCPSWCLQSTLSTLEAWEESPPAHCILYALARFDSRMHLREGLFQCTGQLFWGHVQASPGSRTGPVPGTAAVSMHHRPVRCSRDTGEWRQTGEPSLLPAINTKGDGSM